MIYRDASPNQLKERLEEARARRAGRGFMPYRAPAPHPSDTSASEEKEQHLLDSFPPTEVNRGRFALGALLGLVIFFGWVSWLRPWLSTDLAVISFGVVFGGGWLFLDFRRKARLARGEVAWVKGLPFEIVGYLSALCQDPLARDEYTIRVVVTMKHEPPPAWLLDELPVLSSREMKLHYLERNPLVFSIEGVKVKTRRPARSGAEALASNVLLRDWLHECVTQILLPIDTTYRIQRVEFFSLGWPAV